MARQTHPLFALKASGLLGGHRRGALAPKGLTRTVYPVADSYYTGIPVDTQDNNYGSVNEIYTGAWYIAGTKSILWRSILRFDLRSLIGQSFSSATFSFHVFVTDSDVNTAILSRCTRPNAWREPWVTWNEYDDSQAWTAGGGDFDDLTPPALSFRTDEITVGWNAVTGFLPLVNDALTLRDGWLSFITRLSDELPGVTCRYGYYSRETAQSRMPFLTLTP